MGVPSLHPIVAESGEHPSSIVEQECAERCGPWGYSLGCRQLLIGVEHCCAESSPRMQPGMGINDVSVLK